MFTADRLADLSARKKALLAKRLRGDFTAADQEIARLERRVGVPLSSTQERLWFLDRLTPGSTAYNVPLSLIARGRLDPDAFVAAVGLLVERHEVVRTRFGERDGKPQQ